MQRIPAGLRIGNLLQALAAMQAQLEAQARDLANQAPGEDLVVGEVAVAGTQGEKGQLRHIGRAAHEHLVDGGLDAVVEPHCLGAVAVLGHCQGAADEDLEQHGLGVRQDLGGAGRRNAGASGRVHPRGHVLDVLHDGADGCHRVHDVDFLPVDLHQAHDLGLVELPDGVGGALCEGLGGHGGQQGRGVRRRLGLGSPFVAAAAVSGAGVAHFVEGVLGDVDGEGDAGRAVEEGGGPVGQGGPPGGGRGGERERGRGRREHAILQRREAGGLPLLAEGMDGARERGDMFLQLSHLLGHVAEFVRVLEVGAAVRGVEALQVEVAAPLAGGLAIALDLSSLALVAAGGGGGNGLGLVLSARCRDPSVGRKQS